MAYKLLGLVVWKAAKSLLRYRYGKAMAPKPLVAGGAAAVIAGILLAARGRANDD